MKMHKFTWNQRMRLKYLCIKSHGVKTPTLHKSIVAPDKSGQESDLLQCDEHQVKQRVASATTDIPA